MKRDTGDTPSLDSAETKSINNFSLSFAVRPGTCLLVFSCVIEATEGFSDEEKKKLTEILKVKGNPIASYVKEIPQPFITGEEGLGVKIVFIK
jgi:hypothetical protein